MDWISLAFRAHTIIFLITVICILIPCVWVTAIAFIPQSKFVGKERGYGYASLIDQNFKIARIGEWGNSRIYCDYVLSISLYTASICSIFLALPKKDHCRLLNSNPLKHFPYLNRDVICCISAPPQLLICGKLYYLIKNQIANLWICVDSGKLSIDICNTHII